MSVYLFPLITLLIVGIVGEIVCANIGIKNKRVVVTC